MMDIYLIERLWISEGTYGFTPIGAVETKEEADRICGLKFVDNADHALDFPGQFKATKLKMLDGMSLGRLKLLRRLS